MAFKRFIPKIVVKWNSKYNNYISILTENYIEKKLIGNPISQIKIFDSNEVDEIILINKCEFFEDRFLDLVKQINNFISTPLSVGGKVNTIEQYSSLISSGSDKVIINYTNLDLNFIWKCIEKYGQQSLILSFDYYNTDRDVIIKNIKKHIDLIYETKCGELMLNCISYDGTKLGPDVELIEIFSKYLSKPIISGCGFMNSNDCIRAYNSGANAVSVATYLATTDQSPKQIAAQIKTNNIYLR